VSFLDLVSYRLTATITFEIPELGDFQSEESIRPTVLPVALLTKRPHADLIVKDESGRPLPFLSRIQNDWVTWSVLVSAARGVLSSRLSKQPSAQSAEDDEKQLDDALGALRKLARATWTEADTIRNDLFEKSTSNDVLSRILADDAFVRLMVDLSRNRILLVPAPEAGSRFVWTVTYVGFLRWGLRTGRKVTDFQLVFLPPFALRASDNAPSRRERYRWLRWKQFQRMGWTPARFAFPTAAVSSARSFHFQIESPPGLYITDARLLYSRIDGKRESKQGVVGGHWAHVHSPGRPFARHSKVKIEMVPIPRGLVRHAAVASVVSALVLTVMLLFLSRVLSLGTPTGPAVLLAIPSIILSFIGRPDQHEIHSSMQSGVKWWLFVSSLCLYVGALLIVLRPAPYVLFFLWVFLVMVAWGCAWWIGKSYLTPLRFLSEAPGAIWPQSLDSAEEVDVVATAGDDN
jgi:hypothetical protein